MAFEAHKCNQDGCKGYIVFDNADFDYDEAFEKGEPLAKPECDTCGKEFAVGISHELFEIDDDGEPVAKVPMVCITEYEKFKRKDINQNIEKVIQALSDYEKAVAGMDQDEFDDFYNKCVQHNITNTFLYKFRESLRDVVKKTNL